MLDVRPGPCRPGGSGNRGAASGYLPGVWVPAVDGSIAIGIEASAGDSIPSQALPANSVMVRFGGVAGVNPRLPASSNVRPVAVDLVQSLVSAWQPDVAVLTTRSGNRAQLKQGGPRTPTIGTVTWLSGQLYAVPDSITGALVAPYGDGWLLVVGTRTEPATATDAVLAVRAELDRAGVLVPAPAAQASPPAVPALGLLPPDAEPTATEEPVTAAGNPERVLRRVRGTQVPLPAPLAGLADQPGWPEVIADIRQRFDQLIGWEPFVNQLAELQQRSSDPVFDDLWTELYREVTYPLGLATSGRYVELARGLAAIETLDLPAAVHQLDPGTPIAEAGPELATLRDSVDRVIFDLARHEVGGRFPAAG